MKQGDVELKKEGDKEDKDVAKLVSKVDAKHNVNVTAQGKGQKNDHSFIKGTDKGATSPVIQPQNLSRDIRSEVEHSMETINRVSMMCSVTMLYVSTNLW